MSVIIDKHTSFTKHFIRTDWHNWLIANITLTNRHNSCKEAFQTFLFLTIAYGLHFSVPISLQHTILVIILLFSNHLRIHFWKHKSWILHFYRIFQYAFFSKSVCLFYVILSFSIMICHTHTRIFIWRKRGKIQIYPLQCYIVHLSISFLLCHLFRGDIRAICVCLCVCARVTQPSHNKHSYILHASLYNTPVHTHARTQCNNNLFSVYSTRTQKSY
jgi:hypothetical protein